MQASNLLTGAGAQANLGLIGAGITSGAINSALSGISSCAGGQGGGGSAFANLFGGGSSAGGAGAAGGGNWLGQPMGY